MSKYLKRCVLRWLGIDTRTIAAFAATVAENEVIKIKHDLLAEMDRRMKDDRRQ